MEKRILVGKRILAGIGLMAAIMIFAGIFIPWITWSVLGVTMNMTGWDLVTGTYLGITVEGLRQTYAVLAFSGAIAAIVGALCALAAPKVKLLWAILAIGGILAIVGAVWGFLDIETGTEFGVSISYGYGLYLTLAGGVLALLGTLGGLPGRQPPPGCTQGNPVEAPP